MAELMTCEEAARYTRLSPATLTKWRWAGTGPAFCRLGRRVLYEVAELDRWIAEGRRTSTSEATAN